MTCPRVCTRAVAACPHHGTGVVVSVALGIGGHHPAGLPGAPGNALSHALTHVTDLAPTLAFLAGITLPDATGRLRLHARRLQSTCYKLSCEIPLTGHGLHCLGTR